MRKNQRIEELTFEVVELYLRPCLVSFSCDWHRCKSENKINHGVLSKFHPAKGSSNTAVRGSGRCSGLNVCQHDADCHLANAGDSGWGDGCDASKELRIYEYI